MYTVPDVDGIAVNLRAEYHDIMCKVDGRTIPGLYKEGKEEKYDKFIALVNAMSEYLEAAVPEFNEYEFDKIIFG